MKKLLPIYVILSLVICFPASSQGNLLKKVANSVVDELTSGKPADKPAKEQPEPACACNDAEVILDLSSGKIKIDYTEMNISVMDDGTILIQDRLNSDYYIVKGNTTTGPLKEGDQRLSEFRPPDNTGSEEDNGEESNGVDELVKKYSDYLSRSGDKYLIKFGGKTYGPFAVISAFVVTRSKDKFAANVTENVIVSANDAKSMEEAMKKAKTDQEKMELAMQFSQNMAGTMMQQGGPQSSTPKIITNIKDATADPLFSGTLNSNMKYDEIVLERYDGIFDMKGNKLITIKPEHTGSEIFINSSNTKYAVHGYGNLNFSDGTSMSELFNPHLVKTDGKVYIAYMYYSPKRNSIMQCKIPF